jgi:hypothetical protein
LRIWLCAAFEQQTGRIAVAAGNRPQQGRVAKLIAGIDVGAVGEQRLDRVRSALVGMISAVSPSRSRASMLAPCRSSSSTTSMCP